MAPGVRADRARRGGARGADRRARDQGRGDRASLGGARRRGRGDRCSRSATTRTRTSSASRPWTRGTVPSRSSSASATWPRATWCRGRSPAPGSRSLDEPLGAKSLRGEMSNGMLCSPRELAISQEHETGILILPADLTPGADLKTRARSRRRPPRHRGGTEPAGLPLGLRGGARDVVDPRTAARGARTPISRRRRSERTRWRRSSSARPTAVPPTSRGSSAERPRVRRRSAAQAQAHGRRDAAGRPDRRRDELRDAGARANRCTRSTSHRLAGPGIVVRRAEAGERLDDPRRRGAGAHRRGPR